MSQTSTEQGSEARPSARPCRDLRLRPSDREPPAEYLLERPDGKTTVRQALPLQPRGPLADDPPQFLEQTRLADPGLADEEHDLPLAVCETVRSRVEAVQLDFPAHERRRVRATVIREQRPGELSGSHWPLTAAHGELAERLEAEAMREAAGGLLAHGDRPGSSHCLQARCDVGRIAERDGLVIHGAHDADRGRAGIDADADVESLDPPCLLDLPCVLPHDIHYPQRRAGGSFGVVLVGGRDAEVRADAVAHVRLNRPAVLVHRAAHLVDAFTDQRL